jgi:hypothetical protein
MLKRIMRIASGLNSPIKNRCQENTEWVFRKIPLPENERKNTSFPHFFNGLKTGGCTMISSGPGEQRPRKSPQIQTVSHGKNTVAATT